MDKINLDNVCRCCLTEKDVKDMYQDFIIDDEKVNLIEIIKYVTTLEINEDDGLSRNICLNCIGSVYTSYKCKQLWLNSDETLRKSFDEKKNEANASETKTKFKLKKGVAFCRQCQIYFATISDYYEHKLRVKHRRKRTSYCDVCGKCFTNYELKTHMRAHTKEQPYSCPHCGLKFSLSGNLRRHIRTHTGEKPHKCETCGKAFIQSTSLKQHMLIHTGETPYVCNVCGKKFSQYSQLSTHLTKHAIEDGKLKEITQFACDECNRAFTTKQALRQHQQIHGEKRYLCSDCGRSFSTKASLNTHSKIHTGLKPHTCEVCQKSFSQTGSLKIHLLTHTGVKPYICDECGKRFTQRNHLVYHKRIHTGEKPHQCSVCGKCFSLNGTLTVHMRTHTGETPYHCPVCNKGFYDSSSMKKHRRTHHTKNDQTTIKETMKEEEIT